MKLIRKNLAFVAVATAVVGLALGAQPALAGDKAAKQKDAVTEAEQTLAAMKEADPSLGRTLDKASGYAVFPTISKGGFGIAGAGGDGVLFEKGKPTGSVEMKQLTVGLQAGGEAYSELLIFANAATVTDFKNDKVKFSAGLTAVAASAGASLNAKYQNGVACIISHKGGLMGEVSVGGQHFSYQPFYGEAAPRT